MSPDDLLSDGDFRSLAEFRHALREFLAFSENAARDAGITPHQHQLMLAVRGFPGPGQPSM
ncbi:MAG: MarR family transcriptional regulator, partial [Aquihabitans sp.]